MFASVCPPQPDGGSLFMIFTHSIKVDIFLKNGITNLNFLQSVLHWEYDFSHTADDFLSYNGLWVKWDNFHNYYFFSPFYWTPSMIRFFDQKLSLNVFLFFGGWGAKILYFIKKCHIFRDHVRGGYLHFTNTLLHFWCSIRSNESLRGGQPKLFSRHPSLLDRSMAQKSITF